MFQTGEAWAHADLTEARSLMLKSSSTACAAESAWERPRRARLRPSVRPIEYPGIAANGPATSQAATLMSRRAAEYRERLKGD